MQTLLILISAALVNNFVLNRFLGICPFLGVSKKIETAFSMGMAVTFVMALASAVTYIVDNWILRPLNLEYLYITAFILIVAALVQFVEMFIKKTSPALYQALGIYLPLITTNCAVLGVTVINRVEQYSFIVSVIHAIGAALGFTLAIVLFASIRERIEYNDIPVPFRGLPIALITAGLISIAFLGFTGMIRL